MLTLDVEDPFKKPPPNEQIFAPVFKCLLFKSKIPFVKLNVVPIPFETVKLLPKITVPEPHYLPVKFLMEGFVVEKFDPKAPVPPMLIPPKGSHYGSSASKSSIHR